MKAARKLKIIKRDEESVLSSNAKKLLIANMVRITNLTRKSKFKGQMRKTLSSACNRVHLSSLLPWLKDNGLKWFPAAFVLTLWRYILSTRFVFFTCTGAIIEKKVTRWLPNNTFDEVRQTVYLYSGFVCLSQRAGNWWKPESTTQKCLHKLYLLWSAQKQIQSLALTKPRWSWKSQVCKLLHY